jgi:hypothetical protein
MSVGGPTASIVERYQQMQLTAYRPDRVRVLVESQYLYNLVFGSGNGPCTILVLQ